MTPASWLATEFMFLCSLACDALSPVGCCTDGLCEVELAFFGMAAALSLCAPVYIQALTFHEHSEYLAGLRELWAAALETVRSRERSSKSPTAWRSGPVPGVAVARPSWKGHWRSLPTRRGGL